MSQEVLGQEPHTSEVIAGAAQNLLDKPDEWHSRQAVCALYRDLNRLLAQTTTTPAERYMYAARGSRNAVLAALSFEGALQTLRRLQSGEMATVAMQASWQQAQKTVQSVWPHAPTDTFEPHDFTLLATSFTETNNDFEAVAQAQPVRPDLTKLWHDYNQHVNETTTDFLTFLEAIPPADRSAKQKKQHEWFSRGAPFNTGALERAQRTNRGTTATIFNMLLSAQRRHNNQLTGTELAEYMRTHLNKAAGLSSGLRYAVSDTLSALVCPHAAPAPALISDEHYYKLGQFAHHAHARVPGPCVGYPLLTPGQNDALRADKLDHIAWHRSRTNYGQLAPEYPANFVRASEVAVTQAADIAAYLWPESQPFTLTKVSLSNEHQ